MAISQTSFDQRIKRINNGQTVDMSSQVGRSKMRKSFKARCMTVPFFTGVAILAGMPAYAFVSSEPDMSWVIAEVQKVIALVA